MRLPTRSLACLAVGAGLLSTVPATAAWADKDFHTARYALSPVGGAPLRSGFVIDVHAEGPRIYAQERYHLVGARPSTAYDITLVAYADATCTTRLATIPSVTLTTDARGNAHGSTTFSPADVATFRDLKTGQPVDYLLGWVFSVKGSPAYVTGCQLVTVD